MSPILVRPVREQLEHDRVIRLLQAKYKRKFDVAINPGHQQTAPVGSPTSPWYPDLVLHSVERGRKLAGVVEVETAESVNNLEAMSQWAAFSKQRADFHLYVPAGSIDVARRLCADNGIDVTEIWAYHSVGDQLRFILVQRASGAAVGRAMAAKSANKPAGAANSGRVARPVSKPGPVKAGPTKAAVSAPGGPSKAVGAKAVAPRAVAAQGTRAPAPKIKPVSQGPKAKSGRTPARPGTKPKAKSVAPQGRAPRHAKSR